MFYKSTAFLNIDSKFNTGQIMSYFVFLRVFYLLFCTGHVRGRLNFHGIAIKLFDIIAVYIDSLVMISIERSKTNKKEHWKSETNFFFKRNFFFHSFSIKHDILRLFAKKRIFGENSLSPTLSWTLSCNLSWTLSSTKHCIDIYRQQLQSL